LALCARGLKLWKPPPAQTTWSGRESEPLCSRKRGHIDDNMSGFFFDLGRQLGRRAVPAIRKSAWIWKGLTGSEEEARRAERALGESLAVEVRAATEPADDPEMEAWVNSLCTRLEERLRPPHHRFHCDLIRATEPNAMTLPGGFIFISESLVDLCERRPEELAFVIGHEMAHVVRGHAWDRMIHQAGLRAVSAVASRAGAVGAWLHRQGMGLLLSAYSRDGELEADEFGLRLAAAAGFGAVGALSLLRRLDSLGPDAAGLGQYFASHPSAAERIARLTPLSRKLAGGPGQVQRKDASP
jgi:predicted Zn-dependent protease